MENLQVGTQVFNAETELYGEIIDGGKVAFSKGEKSYKSKVTALWQPIADAPKVTGKKAKVETLPNPPDEIQIENQGEKSISVLESILEKETENSLPMSDVEILRRAELIKQYKDLSKKEAKAVKLVTKEYPFAKALIVSELREKKLHRDSGLNFNEFFAKTFGEHPQTAFKLANIGDFVKVTEIFTKDLDLSGNEVQRFAIGQNQRATALGFDRSKPLQDFEPLLQEVVAITKEVATNDAGKMNFKPVIDKTDAVITEFLTDEKVIDSDDVIALATAKLAENRESLVAKAKAKIAEKVTPNTCEHSLDIESVDNNIVTLTCGCQFRFFGVLPKIN